MLVPTTQALVSVPDPNSPVLEVICTGVGLGLGEITQACLPGAPPGGSLVVLAPSLWLYCFCVSFVVNGRCLGQLFVNLNWVVVAVMGRVCAYNMCA